MSKHYSFLRWVGGKTRLLPTLSSYVKHIRFTRYIEPFVGGGALFFYLAEHGYLLDKEVLLSDLNAELINCYTQIRDNLDGFLAIVEQYPSGINPEFYYQMRSYEPISNLERAARFFYLNQTCFNGVYRVNLQGRFNVPYGNREFYVHTKLLQWCSQLLQHVVLKVSTFESILRDASTGDFVYLDPPYDPLSSTSNFTHYNVDKFGIEHQKSLARYVKLLHDTGCLFLLSNSNTPTILSLYQGFQVRLVHCDRRVSAKASSRKSVQEVLISNIE